MLIVIPRISRITIILCLTPDFRKLLRGLAEKITTDLDSICKKLIFACENDISMKTQSIDNYRLTSMEEPSYEMLVQLMLEAADDARQKKAEATARFFAKLRKDAEKISVSW